MDPFMLRQLAGKRKLDPKGEDGKRGPQGEVGPQGPKGEKGLKGDVGPMGPKGEQGPQGEKGDQGQQGGSTSWRGEWSLKTDYAVNDAVSSEGSSYICILNHNSSSESKPGNDKYWQLLAVKGDQGAQGPKGEQGPRGENGDQGEVGPTGPQGEIGPQGIQGSKGDTGEQGPIGETGPQGATGPQGEAGDTGQQGPIGFTGQQGQPGNEGFFIQYALYAGPLVESGYIYFAKEKNDGSWVVVREDIATTIKTFAAGSSNVTAAWTGRAGLTYQSFSGAF